MRPLFTLLFVFLAAGIFAQDPADIFHKTIPADSIKSVTLDIAETDELSVVNWPGNYILIETSVLMYNGQKNLMRTLKEEGRWDIEPALSGSTLTLTSVEKMRPVMKTKRGLTEDEVTVVIYLPEDFKGSGTSYTRPE